MNKFAVITILCAITFFGISIHAHARAPIPDKTKSFVNDYAGMIDKDTEAYLEKELKAVHKKYGGMDVEIVVSTFPDMEGWDFGDFCAAYGQKWREAEKGRRDNTVIIVITAKEGRIAIGAGDNLKGVITPEKIAYIINKIMVPEFSSGNFSGGTKRAADIIISLLKDSKIPSGDQFLPYKIMALGIIGGVVALIVSIQKS